MCRFFRNYRHKALMRLSFVAEWCELFIAHVLFYCCGCSTRWAIFSSHYILPIRAIVSRSKRLTLLKAAVVYGDPLKRLDQALDILSVFLACCVGWRFQLCVRWACVGDFTGWELCGRVVRCVVNTGWKSCVFSWSIPGRFHLWYSGGFPPLLLAWFRALFRG